MKKLLWIGLLAVAALAPDRAAAWDYPPWKVRGGVNVYLKVQLGAANLPLAPWYTYFPADPRLVPSPQLSPYPPWPTQFPPVSPPSDYPKGAQKQSRDMNVTPGPMLTKVTL